MELTLTRPDDWHLHVRDDAALASVLPHTTRQFGRAIIMPNLVPPVTTTKDAAAYRNRILAALPEGMAFDPLMVLYLTEQTDPADVRAGCETGLVTSVKLYPAGATTNSSSGVRDMDKVMPVLEVMAEIGMPLCVHGEVTDPEIDIFEGYTDNRQGYLKFNRFNPRGWWNLPTNIWTHNNDEGKAVNLRARTGYSGFKDPSKNFIKYTCTWCEEYILIEHNNRIVRVVDDPKVLKYFKDKKMSVIINNHFQNNPPNQDNYSDFTVKYFNYTPL